MSIAIGLDNCRGGWVAAIVKHDRLHAFKYYKSACSALHAYADAAVFAFDIPIGLSPDDRRVADKKARQFLCERASCVFNAPVSTALDATSYDDANKESKRVSGRGLTKQSYALFEKIREVAEIAVADHRVYEAHPEVSFAELAGGSPLPRKKSWNGLMRRRVLLSECGLTIPDVVCVGEGGADDIVDAVACAWTAARIARGEALPLPDPPEQIAGRAVAIWR